MLFIFCWILQTTLTAISDDAVACILQIWWFTLDLHSLFSTLNHSVLAHFSLVKSIIGGLILRLVTIRWLLVIFYRGLLRIGIESLFSIWKDEKTFLADLLFLLIFTDCFSALYPAHSQRFIWYFGSFSIVWRRLDLLIIIALLSEFAVCCWTWLYMDNLLKWLLGLQVIIRRHSWRLSCLLVFCHLYYSDSS